MKTTRPRLLAAFFLPLLILATALVLRERNADKSGGPQDASEALHTPAAPGQDENSGINSREPASPPDWLTPDFLDRLAERPPPTTPRRTAPSDTAAEIQTSAHTRTGTAEPYVGAASFRCVVPDGGAMLTGGWAVPNGGRTFALITPRPSEDPQGQKVTVSTLFFELPAEQSAAPEVIPIEDNAPFTGRSLDAAQAAEFREKSLSKVTRVMSAPTVTMDFGKYASIQVSGSEDGVMLAVIAEQTSNDSGIDLGVSVAEHSGLASDQDD